MTITEQEVVALNHNTAQIAEAIEKLAFSVSVQKEPTLIALALANAFPERANHILQACKAIAATLHEIRERGSDKN